MDMPTTIQETRDDSRAIRLRKVFKTVLSGKRSIADSGIAKLFLEAVRNHENPSTCIEEILASKHGLAAIRSSVRVDLSVPFLQEYTLGLVQYLSHPSIRTLSDGQFLWQILLSIVEPPTVWNALNNVFKQFEEHWLEPFAWIALELLSNTTDQAPDVCADVQLILASGRLQKADSHALRDVAYKLQKLIVTRTQPESSPNGYSPGGRHDNDFADFRKIEIYPTADELLSTEKPYYLRLDEAFQAEPSTIANIHLDNQFRLMREDMLAEIRYDLQVATEKKKGRRRALNLEGLFLSGIDCGNERRGKLVSLILSCEKGIEDLRKIPQAQRRQFLIDNKNYLKHQSFGALMCGNQILGFAFLQRELDLLCKEEPQICLQFTNRQNLKTALQMLRTPANLHFVVVDTPVFAHEPVLEGLKALRELPLGDALIRPASTDMQTEISVAPQLQQAISRLQSMETEGCVIKLGAKNVRVDQSQISSFVAAISQRVSRIQGPPGTGKSFVGSWIAKTLFDCSDLRIFVISYTNHALDQFLEELLDVGIPATKMVRLGSKSTDRTAGLLLSQQKDVFQRSKDSWHIMDALKVEKYELDDRLKGTFETYKQFTASFEVLMEYLEFSEDYEKFHRAFQVPRGEQSWKRVGKKGKEIRPDYLFSRWLDGKSPGVFTNNVAADCEEVWDMQTPKRKAIHGKWIQDIMEEQSDEVEQVAHEFNSIQENLDDMYNERTINILRSRRLIGCTTTAAAMYNKVIRAAEPDVVIVEEAGEIREAHILTALAPSVKQLILIGDHKQLRPKVDNYALTVEKGDGYNLNMSMFERMILQGHGYTTLSKQHRMHPEISCLPRALTYPSLLDGPFTSEHPFIRGLQDRVIFVDHDRPETASAVLSDKQDSKTSSSKQNDFEAQMVLRLVRYLAQQGYGTDKMVVLTPYLGQLRLLRDILKQENDPILNDLDSAPLIQAGLLTQAASKVGKRPLRLSTIDNYQGEESDITIISLTRSNAQGDIGFMSAPERLNVMITRARNCLIMIGNARTFMDSKKGTKTWNPFFQILKDREHLYDGFPVKCERHPEKKAILSVPASFDTHCPNGGCAEPCGTQLSCRLHICQRRCHLVTDHTKVECTQLLTKTCNRQHEIRIPCHKSKSSCYKCISEDRETERRAKRDLDLERRRASQQAVYAKEFQEIQDEIDHERRTMKYAAEEETQKSQLEQQRQQLAALKETAQRKKAMKQTEQARKLLATENAKKAEVEKTRMTQKKSSDITTECSDSAQGQWEYLKQSEGAKIKSLDQLIEMIGLEKVKLQFLDIKATVDTKIRQNVDFSKQRYGCSFLGNPGTGKTTVARLYAEFLATLGVIPSSIFEETSGSKLANMGVAGCQNLVDTMLEKGGGVVFIDEAYQLTSGNSPGGGAVVDYLLAEVENLMGKIVFLLAGYKKQMETFSAHNAGIPSRFPIDMEFVDYTDDELLKILNLKIHKGWNGAMKCEEGTFGLYCRIVARRIGRGRGHEGFGNARTVENVLDQISRRQATRISKARRNKLQPNDFLLTKEDLIGPAPSEALSHSPSWKKLSEMIGLESVKETVKVLLDSIQINYQRELAEEPLVEYTLNKVFLGNPGTGKTTVAKLYGAILADLGLLSNGEVVVKNPSDFIGAVIGGSEKQTKGILASTIGKVLVIDEAYGLYAGSSGLGARSNSFQTAVIDTIVAEVQSVPGDDRCVLLLGYKDQMEDMFHNVNPGLSRRFPMSTAFNFADFSQGQLEQILNMKLKQSGFQATGEAKKVALEMLDRARNRPNFGNAGEIDIILNDTKARHQKRCSSGQAASSQVFEAIDFDENFNRAENTETNVSKLFEGTVGAEEIISKLQGYQETVRDLKSLEMDPKESIPFNFLFKGPPGTGKTTTAKKMGKVFYDMGFLATAEVVECSASDLVAQYIGQTGPKVRQCLDKALGKVLFVDEAYRLAEGHFAQEAIDELVDSVTKEKYFKKLIIILAGYDSDIDRLMTVNQGFTSRFPETVYFRSLKEDECVALLGNVLSARLKNLKTKNNTFDFSILLTPTPAFRARLEDLFLNLILQSSWASARDVKTLAMEVFKKVINLKSTGTERRFTLTEAIVIDELQSMYQERAKRNLATASRSRNRNNNLPAYQPRPDISSSVARDTSAGMQSNAKEDGPSPPSDNSKDAQKSTKKQVPRPDGHQATRDAGVSDEVWAQLQKDAQAARERIEETKRLRMELHTTSEANRDKIVKRLLEEERKQAEELAMKEKLKMMGLCPMGYDWIKQATGYRCAGGSHFIPDP
ncbi:hypothetical protein PFICI_14234 [Pestalotiopsis fici W106-1]|uniref:AAA+ ATPase domain-containing protein n=1 Tax=Pestalotiopsis fici (strain W106-1 / CGMCC3.15140) TaxID=1229662 RepID=W3WKG8_PESFW|nr:uncharacterized protein PFICI_14234 [Pestalotiopsis fici W106-1]ETS74368.1 hypothetical protein PFICI_14234 [Pestalotiopsis fici W106-1]